MQLFGPPLDAIVVFSSLWHEGPSSSFFSEGWEPEFAVVCRSFTAQCKHPGTHLRGHRSPASAWKGAPLMLACLKHTVLPLVAPAMMPQILLPLKLLRGRLHAESAGLCCGRDRPRPLWCACRL